MTTMMRTILILVGFVCFCQLCSNNNRPLFRVAEAKDYYYTRTRQDPQHLRISEEFKNKYVDEIKYNSRINGTNYEYYKSSMAMSHDELVFETIDKIFRHRLSAFYVHHYDREEDKRLSSDARKVSHEACARDLMYLVDKLPKKYNSREPLTNHDEDHLSPELTAFFDSFGRQEAGLLMGNTYWVGAYDQCVNRHIFEITGSQHPDLQKVGKDPDQQVVSFKGRYCVSALKSPTWDSIIASKKTREKHYFKTEHQIREYSKLFRLQVGICLPDSCDSSSYERHAEEIKLLTTSVLEQRYADYELIDLYCLPDESSALRAWSGSALAFLIFLGLWLTLIFLATVADSFEFVDTLNESSKAARGAVPHKQNWTKLQRFVTWFSLRANYGKLMKVADERRKGQSSPSQKSQREDSISEKQEKRSSVKHADNTGENPRANADVSCAETSADHRDSATTDQQPATDHSNGSASTHTKSQPQQPPQLKVDLRFLNAFKVMIMFWIINGHIMLLMIQTAKNILYSDALLNGLMHFLIGATFGVDLFFTMTGFLTAYLIFDSGMAFKMKPATWLYLSFHRYWRLAPMYLITFWFSRSVMQLLGSGPLWDYGTSNLTFRGLCNQESWWYPFTLTSNLHGLFEECMITSWYISCDMQFWLVSPIFIYLLAKKPMHGWMASLATIVMSSKLRYDSLLGEQSARYDELVQPRADIFMRVSHDLPALYTHPHYRISAYIVGLLAGHYVYMLKAGKMKSSITAGCPLEVSEESASATNGAKGDQQQKQEQNVNKEDVSSTTTATVTSTTATSAAKTKIDGYQKAKALAGSKKRQLIAYFGLTAFLVMSFVSYLLSHYYPSSMLKYAKTVAGIAYALDHLFMSIGASMIIVSMCFGQWSVVNRFLSHPIWTRLSKINYALLLLQCEAIYYQIFRYEQVPVAGTRELINILFNLLVTLYPLAFAVTLVFEFPLANIEKLLI